MYNTYKMHDANYWYVRQEFSQEHANGFGVYHWYVCVPKEGGTVLSEHGDVAVALKNLDLDVRNHDYAELGYGMKYSHRSTKHWACFGDTHQVQTPISVVPQRHWAACVHVTCLTEHDQSKPFEDQSLFLANWDLTW